MTVDASINVHGTKITAQVNNFDTFWTYQIGGVTFHLETEDLLFDFRTAIYDAYTIYKSKPEIALK